MAITLTLGMAAQAGAWMGGPGNHDCDGPRGNGMMNSGTMMDQNVRPSLTTEQRQQVEAITSRYQDELQSREKAIQDKIAAINEARNNDSTTMSELRTKRQELHNLRQDYWQTRQAVNKEITDSLGENYSGAGGWGPRYCDLDDMGNMDNMDGNHGGMMMGRGRHCRR